MSNKISWKVFCIAVYTWYSIIWFKVGLFLILPLLTLVFLCINDINILNQVNFILWINNTSLLNIDPDNINNFTYTIYKNRYLLWFYFF